MLNIETKKIFFTIKYMQDNYNYNYIDYINFDNLQISRIKYSLNMETEIHMHVNHIKLTFRNNLHKMNHSEYSRK